ncbi:hypothetical protein C8R43DRAFT_962668 [Mycena crocata]|nr:hypothetical protein C8R43DRAFT_962668 [Mycena crocata]
MPEALSAVGGVAHRLLGWGVTLGRLRRGLGALPETYKISSIVRSSWGLSGCATVSLPILPTWLRKLRPPQQYGPVSPVLQRLHDRDEHMAPLKALGGKIECVQPCNKCGIFEHTHSRSLALKSFCLTGSQRRERTRHQLSSFCILLVTIPNRRLIFTTQPATNFPFPQRNHTPRAPYRPEFHIILPPPCIFTSCPPVSLTMRAPLPSPSLIAQSSFVSFSQFRSNPTYDSALFAQLKSPTAAIFFHCAAEYTCDALG